MTATPPPSDSVAWVSTDGTTWSHAPAGTVTKIVIGTPPKPGEDAMLVSLNGEVLEKLPELLASPALTHLHLWGIDNLGGVLTQLPGKLQVLDVRGCPDLKTLSEFPTSLESLVLMGCGSLKQIPGSPREPFSALWDLCLSGSHQLNEATLHRLIKAAPALKHLDFSGSSALTTIPAWPAGLERVDLLKCSNLRSLPKRFPASIRRIGLRNCSALEAVAELPVAADYVDFSGMEKLKALPPFLGRPRTLFLYGSGLLMPPASEHGKSPDENVAARTHAYFDDVRIAGTGEVRRCKLLLLGNGSAGKTCLSLALVPDLDPAQVDQMGTTHGIQFFDWDMEAEVGPFTETVHLHLWDFGGQEIYHNTHRLFMSKGSVFIVVWNPEQDGRKPAVSSCGYQDEWHPLAYWLDYIHAACPHRPRIAIVCSHHTAPEAGLEHRWRAEAGAWAEDCRCFYIDSRHRQGQLDDLKTWLRQEVGHVVHTQGTMVPSYWEIAQGMVRDWLPRTENGTTSQAVYNELHPDHFRELLDGALSEAIRRSQDDSLSQLSAALNDGRFELNADRVTRALEFLTHSGWLYWDAKLFEGRIIIGQQWALDGIYTVLDRRPKSIIWRVLTEADGRFTRSMLGQLAWDSGAASGLHDYTGAEQELLLTFMEQCGLCFKLRDAADAWREETVYVSCEHLPSARVARLQHEFDSGTSDLNLPTETLELPRLHKGHWQAILTAAGSEYGKNAAYASDGLCFSTKNGGNVLIIAFAGKSGGVFGGRIEVQTSGTDALELLGKTVTWLKAFLPGSEIVNPPSAKQTIGDTKEVEEVFISYSWDPQEKHWKDGIPPGYEVPVDAIEKFLREKPVRLIRDKNDTGFGTNLRNFMEHGATRPHVIVVHSDKYWRSPYCIFELWMVMEELRRNSGKALPSVVIPVEHLDSGITKQENLHKYLEEWRTFSGTPQLIGWEPQKLRDHAVSLLRDFSKDLHEHLNLNIRWSGDGSRALEDIAARLGITDKKTDE